MYNLTDMHVHTKFSWDAQQDMNEVAKKAKERGLKIVTFTEHVDFQDDHHKNYTKFDFDGYDAAVKAAQEIFPGARKGIEAGETHLFMDRFDRFVEGRDFDYVIGALHSIGGYTPVFDEYFRQYKNADDAYRVYLDEEYELIKAGGFDAAAHLTLMHRTGAKYNPDFCYEKFKAEIDDLLKLLISKKIAMEINCSGMRSPSKDFLPGMDIVKAYLGLGGDMITVGSDSHKIQDFFFGVEEAYRALDSLGLTHVTVFEKRRPIKLPLKAEK